MAALCAAACQDLAAFLSAHALAKTVLVDTLTARRLKSPFHRSFILGVQR